MRKAVLVTSSIVVIAGLLTATASARYASAAIARDFVEGYREVAGDTEPVILPSKAVGSVPIQTDLLEPPAVQRSGAMQAFLSRSHRSLPLHELAVGKPRVWVFCRSTVVGPFLIVTDVDGAWELPGATHQRIERTLRLVFGSRSVELSSWGNGAMYDH